MKSVLPSLPFVVLCLQTVLYLSENTSYQVLRFHKSYSFHIQVKKLIFSCSVLLNHKPGEVGESFHAAQDIIRSHFLQIIRHSHAVWLRLFSKKKARDKYEFVGVRVTQAISGL